MNKVAKFEKVSYEQFAYDWKYVFPLATDEEIESIYDSIMLPRRSTIGSAGYDFYLPDDIAYNLYVPGIGRIYITQGTKAVQLQKVIQAYCRNG